MAIKFFKSDLNKLPQYIELYKRCFKKYPEKKDFNYFTWLYRKNPLGSFIGIDAFDTDKNIEIGQVGGIPYNFNYLGKPIKILQSINVCVDQRYRGQKLFKEMSSRLEDYAKELNFSFIIAIANALATPAWMNSISMKFLTKLDVFLTYNLSEFEKMKFDNNTFRSIWDENLINWRKKNPYNPAKILKGKNIKFTSLSVLSKFKVFSYLENNNYLLNYDKKEFDILPNLFVGLLPKQVETIHFKIPEILKPSPLNFLYKNISEKNLDINKKKCYFSYLDFDAY